MEDVMSTRQEAGRKGAEARHAKSSGEESAIAKKAAATRKQKESSSKTGRRGGR